MTEFKQWICSFCLLFDTVFSLVCRFYVCSRSPSVVKLINFDITFASRFGEFLTVIHFTVIFTHKLHVALNVVPKSFATKATQMYLCQQVFLFVAKLSVFYIKYHILACPWITWRQTHFSHFELRAFNAWFILFDC